MRLEHISDDFDAPGSASKALVRSALGGAAVAGLVLVYLQSFSDRSWPELPGFVWAHALTHLLAGGVMSALLAYQALASKSRSVSVLAGTMLFTALMYVTFFLTFPGTLTEGIWIGGSQSPVWAYQIEHFGVIGGVLAAAALALSRRRLGPPQANWAAWSLITAALLAAALSLVVIAYAESLPVLLDRSQAEPMQPPFRVIRWIINILSVLALALSLLAARTRSRANVWLALAAFLILAQSFKIGQAEDRYTAAWYLGRTFDMVGLVLLLIVLILEVLRQSRELVERRAESVRLAQVVEQSPLSQYVVDNDMRVLDVNEAFTHLTGYTRDELLGRPLPIVPDPGTETLAWSLLERLRTGAAASVSMRVQVPRRDRAPIWADWSAHALFDAAKQIVGNAGSFTDASAAMAMDLDMQVPVGVALVSDHWRFTQANAALCHMTEHTMIELLDTPISDIFVDEDRTKVSALFDEIATQAQSSGTVECRIARKDGSALWVLLYAARLSTPEGGFEGASLQIIDANKRKLAEEAAEVAEREIHYRAHYDLLTGLMNHQSLVDRIDASLRTVDSRRHVAVVILDIDGFQGVSNALTRVQGDEVLRQLGELIVEHVGSRDQVARLGTDEFAFTVDASDGVEVAQLVQRLMQAVTDHEFGAADKHIYLTVSVGVTLGHGDAVAADLVQEADMAMRQAQLRGRGHWQMFTHEYRAEVQSRIDLTHEMHDALRHKEFVAWYMPIVRLDDRTIDGYEALVRWSSATGMRPPDVFLKVAEETGLIIDVGWQIFDQAVRELASLPSPLRIAVNASPTQLLRGDVFFHIRNLLTETGVEPQRLVVEITEQSLFESKRAADANLFQLAELGVGIHVDDFGTGYSSITHIRDFPITGLKLDTSFTAGLDRGHTQSIELAGILGELTHRLGIEGIAEGVETETQAAKLRDLGWTFGQGWLFGKPAPAPQLPTAP